MSQLATLVMADNPEVQMVSAAANYGPMIALMMTAILMFIIGFITLFAEKSSHIPGAMMLGFSMLLGAESIFLGYKAYKVNNKKK
jgi:hypothetical protein